MTEHECVHSESPSETKIVFRRGVLRENPDKIQRVLELISKGTTTREIERLTGVSRSGVSRIRKQHGII